MKLRNSRIIEGDDILAQDIVQLITRPVGAWRVEEKSSTFKFCLLQCSSSYLVSLSGNESVYHTRRGLWS